jgi:hypothetical protein
MVAVGAVGQVYHQGHLSYLKQREKKKTKKKGADERQSLQLLTSVKQRFL